MIGRVLAALLGAWIVAQYGALPLATLAEDVSRYVRRLF